MTGGLTDVHQPLAVYSVDGMPFVKCSCDIGYRPQSAVWLREHWQGSVNDGEAALRAVVARQAAPPQGGVTVADLTDTEREALRTAYEAVSPGLALEAAVEQIVAARVEAALAHVDSVEQAVAAVLAEHESLLGSDDYTSCVCGAETGTLGGLRAHVTAHVAAALAPLLAAERARALRERGLDPTPETVGDPHRHTEAPYTGRTCLARADGSGWWPIRWEGGKPNPSGATCCLAPHPRRERGEATT